MYPYNYNYNGNYKNSIYTPAIDTNNERLAGGFIAPLLLGGVAGYAIGQNNYNTRPYYFYTQPRPFYMPYNPYYNPWFR